MSLSRTAALAWAAIAEAGLAGVVDAIHRSRPLYVGDVEFTALGLTRPPVKAVVGRACGDACVRARRSHIVATVLTRAAQRLPPPLRTRDLRLLTCRSGARGMVMV